MTYSEKIVKLRKANGYSQEAFAKLVGVSRQAVYKWEAGQSYPEAEKLSEIKKLLGAEVICGENFLDRDVYSACGSDMMSDVLAYVKDQAVLLTGLCNPQVVRTAMMMDMKCIVFVRGKEPTKEIVQLAEDAGIVVMTSSYRMYVACGLLYSEGLTGGECCK